MHKIFAAAAPSSSVTYGNVSCAVRELIKSKFPYDYFKYTNISSEMAYRNIFRQFGGTNNKMEFNKRKKPYLIINPIYREHDPDAFMNEIPLTKNMDNMQYGFDRKFLFNVVNDMENDYALRYKVNRDVIEFDVQVVVSTLHQQLDIYKFMYNTMVWNRPYVIRLALESIIPRNIISQIGLIMDMDIDNPNQNMTPVMLQYLNKVSAYPITYKLKNASALDEFFMYYNHNAIITFTDISIEDGNKKNMSDESYTISFKVQTEFNLPGLYILEGKPDLNKKLKISVGVYDVYKNTTEFVPIMTIDNLHHRFPVEKDGLRLYTTSMFNISKDKNSNKDTLDIGELFDNNIIQIIRENYEYNVPMDTFIKVIVTKDNEEILEGIDYKVNWTNLTIDVYNLDVTSTYRLILYINNLKLNQRLIEITHTHNTDKSQL